MALTLPFLLACLVGCSVGPEYVRPEIALPESWEHLPESQRSRQVELAMGKNKIQVVDDPAHDGSLPENTQVWWEAFCDGDMKRLIARLIAANPDLHRARARIDEALAQRRTHTAAHWPHADFNARTDRGFGEFDSRGRVRASRPRSKEEFWQLDAGWELDLFGEHARKVEASDRQAQATIESWRDTLVFLIGEIGLYYIEMRVNEERARLAVEFAEAYRDVARITALKEERGAASRLEVEESEARLRRQEAFIPEYERLAAQARHQLARLLATSSRGLSKYLTRSGPVPTPPPTIYAGIPAEVMRARADIRAAEDRIAAQVARVGEATAQLYPKLRLSGAITFESLATGDVTSFVRRTIGGGAGLTKRIFHAGADKARVAEQDALLQQTIRLYESAVYQAMNEVNDALADLHYGYQRRESLDDAVLSSANASRRVRDAYRSGLVDISKLLRVVEEDFEIQTEHLFARNLLAKASVRLYKATGGGQLPLPPKETPINLVATEVPGDYRPLSVLFSLGADEKWTLHRRRMLAARKRATETRELLHGVERAPTLPNFRRQPLQKSKAYPFARAYFPQGD